MRNNKRNKKGLKSLSLYGASIPVQDVDISSKWYRDVFGFKLEFTGPLSTPKGSRASSILVLGEMRLQRFEVDLKTRETTHDNAIQSKDIHGTSFIIQVNDLALASAELEEKGVPFVSREQYMSGSFMLCSEITDIDGNEINILQSDTVIKVTKKKKAINIEKVIGKHLSIWNEISSTKRLATIRKLYAKNVKLREPFFSADGAEEINTFIDNLLKIYHGFSMCINGEVIFQEDTLKFNWCFGPEKAPKKVTGTHIIILNKNVVSSLIVFVDDHKMLPQSNM